MILLEDLQKRFGKVPALRDLSLAVPAGQTLALLGPNGSGKSTTLKCLVGLTRPDRGRIRLDGIDLAARREEALSRVSYLPQHPRFPETLTGREVIRFHARLRRLERRREETAILESGLDGRIERRVGGYSGGMAQRLALAVLSLPDAPILLLDEPTAGLDPEGREHLNRWLEDQERRGKTIVFTTHRLEDAEGLAQRVAVLLDGRLAADLSREELRGRDRVEVSLDLEVFQAVFREVVVETGAEVLSSGESGRLVFAAPAKAAVEALERLRAAGARISGLRSSSSLERFYRQVTSHDSR